MWKDGWAGLRRTIGNRVTAKPVRGFESLSFRQTTLKNSASFLYAGMVELADTPDLGSGAKACRFKSCYPYQKINNFCLPKVASFFIQAAGLVYHHRTKCGAYHQPLWGCISPRASVHYSAAWWDTTLCVDDIQCFALMICNGKPLIFYSTVILYL